MKVFIVGTGYVASAYLRFLLRDGINAIALSRRWCDYYDQTQLHDLFLTHSPDIVINAAGYTGETVDDCEVLANKTECYQANTTLARTVAQCCEMRGAKLAHISSGCIYDGDGVFDEGATPNNSCHYALCKEGGERAIAEFSGSAYIFRIRMPFNGQRNRRNWLCKLIQYDRILDGLNSVTPLTEFVAKSFSVVLSSPPGIYNSCCSVPIRTAEVARLLYDSGLRTKPVELYPEDEFVKDHVKRSSAVLDCRKFEAAAGRSLGDTEETILRSIVQLKG